MEVMSPHTHAREHSGEPLMNTLHKWYSVGGQNRNSVPLKLPIITSVNSTSNRPYWILVYIEMFGIICQPNNSLLVKTINKKFC